MIQRYILDEIAHERKQQLAKWGEQQHSPEKWIAILAEEVGEASAAALEGRLDQVVYELIQAAAACVAATEDLVPSIAELEHYFRPPSPESEEGDATHMYATYRERSYIVVRWTQPYVHSWAQAHGRHNYLKHLHRHLLHIEVTLGVTALNRQLEFLEVRENLKANLEAMIQDCASHGDLERMHPGLRERVKEALREIGDLKASCETIAFALCQLARLSYGPDRYVKVAVFEDGENGGVFECIP
jgi:hypothetical protein